MKKEINKAILLSAGQLLIENQLTVAFAESATAGRICAEFGLVPDAGKFLKGGIVCYDATLKESLLGVPDEQINTRIEHRHLLYHRRRKKANTC